MRSWRQSKGRSLPLRRNKAFSLIELMVAVTMLSFLMLLAVPAYQKLHRKAKAVAVANDLRVFAAAFQAHVHETGAWPSEVAAGVVPPEMTATELKYDDWTRVTPMGGRFDWEYNQKHGESQYRAAIAITSTADSPVNADAELFLEIDKAMDDGDPNSGIFLLGFGGTPLFVIEK